MGLSERAPSQAEIIEAARTIAAVDVVLATEEERERAIHAAQLLQRECVELLDHLHEHHGAPFRVPSALERVVVPVANAAYRVRCSDCRDTGERPIGLTATVPCGCGAS